MNLSEGIEKIKGIVAKFMGEEAPAPITPTEPVVLATDIPLADGSTLTVATLEVGADAKTGDAPAADGDYIAEDATVIKVVSGLIAEIIAVEAAPAEVPAEVPAEMNQLPAQFASMKETFETKLKAVESKYAAQSEVNKKYKEFADQAILMFEQLAAKSIEEPTEKVIDWNSLTNFQKLKANRGEL